MKIEIRIYKKLQLVFRFEYNNFKGRKKPNPYRFKVKDSAITFCYIQVQRNYRMILCNHGQSKKHRLDRSILTDHVHSVPKQIVNWTLKESIIPHKGNYTPKDFKWPTKQMMLIKSLANVHVKKSITMAFRNPGFFSLSGKISKCLLHTSRNISGFLFPYICSGFPLCEWWAASDEIDQSTDSQYNPSLECIYSRSG